MQISTKTRITAAFVGFCFTFTNLLPSGFSQANFSRADGVLVPEFEIGLPPELGKIDEYHAPAPSSDSKIPFIIHIQTAHGDI